MAGSNGFFFLMSFYLYILKSINFEKTYIGHTNNLKRRLREHNSGKSEYTSKFKPWKVLYTEIFPSRDKAILREKYFKSAAGRKKIKILVLNAHVAQQDRATVS